MPVGTDGNHHATLGGELFDQRLRNVIGRRGHDDRIEGRGFGPALVAIADSHLHILGAEPVQHLARARAEWRDDLDRVHLRHALGEHRRLVPRARANLQHALPRLAGA